MTKIRDFIEDTRGDAINVEAAILFPVMIMIIAAIFLLSIYLPQRAILQEAAQVAAVAVATDRSDTWISFDGQANVLRREDGDISLPNVYRSFFGGAGSMLSQADVESIVETVVGRGFVTFPNSTIEVNRNITNHFIYKSVTVTVTQRIPVPVNLSLVGFPTEAVIIQEARAIVSNGDEFVRTIDIAVDLVDWIRNRFNSEDFGGAIDQTNDGEIRGMFGF